MIRTLSWTKLNRVVIVWIWILDMILIESKFHSKLNIIAQMLPRIFLSRSTSRESKLSKQLQSLQHILIFKLQMYKIYKQPIFCSIGLLLTWLLINLSPWLILILQCRLLLITSWVLKLLPYSSSTILTQLFHFFQLASVWILSPSSMYRLL